MGQQGMVAEHYGSQPVLERVNAALARAGLTADRLGWRDLAPIDQFHAGGLKATAELAKALAPGPSDSVLDVGSGTGGPARFLAATYGCHLTGIDLTEAFVEVATMLSERVGMSDKTSFLRADALDLPFPDAAFDHVWTIHVAMNIADRDQLYGEIHRVLKPGGRLAIFDVVQAEGGPVIFPVPWARTPEISFLLTSGAMRDVLTRAGFRIGSWVDKTDLTLEWVLEQREKRAATAPSPLGIQTVMGDDLPAMSVNFVRNLQEGRIGIAQVIATRS
jgi:ubiquinone/menaquinone biosynthesis C-methylase UbiE